MAVILAELPDARRVEYRICGRSKTCLIFVKRKGDKDMNIKGTAIESVREFVKVKYNSRLNEWIDSLPAESKKIIKESYPTKWYPINEAITEPTKKICELFYNGDIRGAWESGRFSADHALKGVYKLFVIFGNPVAAMEKAVVALPTYYQGSELKAVKLDEKKYALQMMKLPESNKYIEHRIGGWTERALEICGAKGVSLKITKQLSKGDAFTEYIAEWK